MGRLALTSHCRLGSKFRGSFLWSTHMLKQLDDLIVSASQMLKILVWSPIQFWYCTFCCWVCWDYWKWLFSDNIYLMQLTNCFLASQENGLKFQADGDRLTPVSCIIYRLSRLQKLTLTNGTVKIRPAPLPSPAEVPEHSVSLTELQLIGFRIITANLRSIAKSLTGLTLLELSNCVRANPAS